jgi:uncharacterized membrane protein
MVMSDLVVLGFDTVFKAEEVLLTLRKLQQQHLLDLEDAAVVIRQADGTVQVKQSQPLVAAGAATGALQGTLLGSLIGLLFLNPLIGAVIGAGLGAGGGAATGALLDVGINDDFIKATGKTIQPGTSALFVLVRRATPDRVIAEVKPYNPTVLHTSLSAKDETELRQALAAKQEAQVVQRAAGA